MRGLPQLGAEGAICSVQAGGRAHCSGAAANLYVVLSISKMPSYVFWPKAIRFEHMMISRSARNDVQYSNPYRKAQRSSVRGDGISHSMGARLKLSLHAVKYSNPA